MKNGRILSSVKIMVDEKILQQKGELRYLASVLTDDGRSGKDICIRIRMAKSAFYKMGLLISGGMGQQLK